MIYRLVIVTIFVIVTLILLMIYFIREHHYRKKELRHMADMLDDGILNCNVNTESIR